MQNGGSKVQSTTFIQSHFTIQIPTESVICEVCNCSFNVKVFTSQAFCFLFWKKGIENRVDYLRQLDVKGIWISPIFTSPMVDHGYDISNYTDIDPIFGTIEDFKNLVLKCTSNNIKIILDFVPNHTSDQHQWFLKSCQRIDPYTDFYVWQKGDKEGKKPPSNWVSKNNACSLKQKWSDQFDQRLFVPDVRFWWFCLALQWDQARILPTSIL